MIGFLKTKWQRLKWRLTPAGKKSKALQEVLDLVRSASPETANLLKLAEEQGVSILQSADLIGSGTIARFCADEKTGHKCIEIRPGMSVEETYSFLIHELRHMWQRTVLGDLYQDTFSYGPRAALMRTRILEADAYAFQAVVGFHTIQYSDSLWQLISLREEIERLRNIQGSASDKGIKNLDKNLQEYFSKAFSASLEYLGSYDGKSIRRYHACYTTPRFEPLERTEGVDLERNVVLPLRKALSVEFNSEAGNYMADLDDAAFEALVMKGVRPEIIEVVDLMEEFERATAGPGGLSEEQNMAMRRQIDEKVRALKLSSV